MTLADDFEQQLEHALLDDVEQQLRSDIIPEAIDRSYDVLREYGARYDYDVEPIVDSLEGPTIERTDRRVRARWGWAHSAAPFFELGTSDHTVDGDPVLSFVWEDPPQWVREEFEREGEGWRVFFDSVEVSGLPESRFVRDTLNWLRREVAR